MRKMARWSDDSLKKVTQEYIHKYINANASTDDLLALGD